MTDAVLNRPPNGHFDFAIDTNGDILQADFFDTAILVSIYERKRASESEISRPEFREGWIGNESIPDFERGSKIWLYEQSRLTRDVMNNIIDAANESLAWLMSEGFAVDIVSDVNRKKGRVFLNITIQRPESITIKKELFLWDNSGITEAA